MADEVRSATNGKSADDMAPAAKVAIEAFVNAQGCKSEEDVLRALDALGGVALQAVLLVKSGRKAVVQ